MEPFSTLLAFCEESSSHWWIPLTKGQWHKALMGFFIRTWMNGWANNQDATLIPHHTHYDVTVMMSWISPVLVHPIKYAQGCVVLCGVVWWGCAVHFVVVIYYGLLMEWLGSHVGFFCSWILSLVWVWILTPNLNRILFVSVGRSLLILSWSLIYNFSFHFERHMLLKAILMEGRDLHLVILHGPLTSYINLWVGHVPGMLGTFFLPPTSKETASYRFRNASRHVRHVRVVMHVRIGNLPWQGKRSRYSQHMCNPQFYLSDKRPIVNHGCWWLGIFHEFCKKNDHKLSRVQSIRKTFRLLYYVHIL